MLMDSQVKFHIPQNISEASEQNGVATSSWTTEVAGDGLMPLMTVQEKNRLQLVSLAWLETVGKG